MIDFAPVTSYGELGMCPGVFLNKMINFLLMHNSATVKISLFT